MKKTITTMAAALLLMVTGVNAENGKNSTDRTVMDITTKTVTSAGINSFCKAIMQGDIATVKKLIALGEDVNKKSLGKTPAIFAARYNKAEILKVLIANGADLKIKCDKGMTAKKYAELSNAKEALEVIEAATK